MLDRGSLYSRLTTATLRRITALTLVRTNRYGLRTITAPGLVAAAPNEHIDPRPSI